ncbi:MAG: aminoacetone oxidase family FAD-binding enzyme [Ruminococcus sp.]|nr:aminoacetone oxidase family FAD-binding enzyme [Ruminococcus sp.]
MFADIVVVGGGASGMAAAIGAKEAAPAAEVVITERLDRVGKKILATGNGRCNLGNRDVSAAHYHGSFRSMSSILSRFPAEGLFRPLGVLCTADEQGRMYPRSNAAATVLNALRMRLAELGIKEVCNFDLSTYLRKGDLFELSSDDGQKISCRKIIIAAGGYAAPQYGTDGAVMRMLRDKGYRIEKICPAVAPLRVSPDSVKGLKGVRVKGLVQAYSDGRLIAGEEGEIQFTENSISGICAFNMARYCQEYEGRLEIRLDLAPDMTYDELKKYVHEQRTKRARLELNDLLTGAFAKNLAVYLVKNMIGRPMTDKIATITDTEADKLCGSVKELRFTITGSTPWKSAQVTAGGVHKCCVGEDLGSLLEKGVYLCGELLDMDGDCGGFNLQWAWASGLTAGRNCGASLKGADR